MLDLKDTVDVLLKHSEIVHKVYNSNVRVNKALSIRILIDLPASIALVRTERDRHNI